MNWRVLLGKGDSALDGATVHSERGLAFGLNPAQDRVPMKKYFVTAIVLAVLLVGALMVVPELLQKWLWMRQLNYEGIFWTLLSVKWGMTCAAFIGVFLFLCFCCGRSFASVRRD